MPNDYFSAQVREAADGVTEWDQQDVVYVAAWDGNLAAWQAVQLAQGLDDTAFA